MDDDDRLEKLARLEERMGTVETGLLKAEGEYKELRKDLNDMLLENTKMSEKINAILSTLDKMSRQKMRTVDVIMTLGMLALGIMTYLK